MKNNYEKFGEYASPSSTPLDVMFEGTLCTSTLPDAQLEGYGVQDQFSGWSN